MIQSSYLPKYKKVIQYIKQLIIEDHLEKGDMIPTEKLLQEQLGVSRVTVRKAIGELIQEGVLASTQGSGTFVNETKARHDIFQLKGFTEEMKDQSFDTMNEVTMFQLEVPSEELQKLFEVKADSHVYHIVRIRYLNHKPALVEESFMPFYLFPDLSVTVMEGSKYYYVEEIKNYQILESQQVITPYMPTEELQQLLKVPSDKPILNIQLHSYLTTGEVFEFTNMYYSTDKVNFSIKAKRIFD